MMPAARALGGGALSGDKLVRYVYLDETGTGDPKAEPFVIVAGVMIHAVASEWKVIENHLNILADGFALREDRPGCCFHAQELFTGGKREFYEKYPLEKRHDALAAICEIPQRFSLPVFMYAIDRAQYVILRPGLSRNELLTEELMHASIACATGVERYIREHLPPDEVATLVYEYNSDKNQHIADYHQLFRSDVIEAVLAKLEKPRLLKLERIIESAMFSKKTSSSLLQIADACAYILGRRMRGVGLPDRFYVPVRRQLVFGHTRIMADRRGL